MRIDPNISFRERIPYGTPMYNQHFYVLNQKNELCPDWVIGELCIGGKGVARGYLNDSELTNKKFFESSQLHDRLYRTGDVGRYRSDGHIEILGRLDAQVKIQGHRVELGEIEACINQYPEIMGSIVYLPEPNSNFSGLLCCVQVSEQVISKYDMNVEESVKSLIPSTIIDSDWNDCPVHPYQRKSYRHFVKNVIDIKSIKQILNFNSLNRQDKSNNVEYHNQIINLLKPLGIYATSNIHKHCYPSAGNIYPFQIYLHNLKQDEKLPVGLYLFDPFLKVLNPSTKMLELPHTTLNADGVLHFEVDLAKVKEKYNQDARRFVLIELGHIIGLLSDELNAQIKFEHLEIFENDSDSDQFVLATLNINPVADSCLESELNAKLPDIYLFTKTEHLCAWYQYELRNNQLIQLQRN